MIDSRRVLCSDRDMPRGPAAAILTAVFLAMSPLPGAAQPAIDQVAWLQGCWRMSANGRTVDEQWTSPAGGAMLATSRTVRDGKLVEYEFVVLREKDGGLVYEAHPSGQAGGAFPMKTIEASSVVFENPTHDFPQRIGYRRTGERLDAWIEGTMNGKTRRAEFPYVRVACPAP